MEASRGQASAERKQTLWVPNYRVGLMPDGPRARHVFDSGPLLCLLRRLASPSVSHHTPPPPSLGWPNPSRVGWAEPCMGFAQQLFR
jgi:hypothetical protein